MRQIPGYMETRRLLGLPDQCINVSADGGMYGIGGVSNERKLKQRKKVKTR